MNLPLTLLTASLAFAAAPSAPPTSDVTGTIVETMDAGGYTYLLLKTASGDKWAAVSQTKVKKGDKATVAGAMDMANFESPTLKRRFDHIAFGALQAPGAPAGAPHGGAPHGGAMKGGAMGGMPAGHGRSAAPKDFGPIKVAKAAGPDARTVAEVYAQKKALKGNDVVVSGKVVKYNAGILDRNWAHLRDGSGSAKDGSDDLTVLLKDGTAELGQVITVRGRVFLDKDLGGMYKFPVCLEDASLINK